MKNLISDRQQLEEKIGYWEDQKYEDRNAAQEAMMNGRRHNKEITEKTTKGLRWAKMDLSNFDYQNPEVFEAQEKVEVQEAQKKSDKAYKAVWNS